MPSTHASRVCAVRSNSIRPTQAQSVPCVVWAICSCHRSNTRRTTTERGSHPVEKAAGRPATMTARRDTVAPLGSWSWNGSADGNSNSRFRSIPACMSASGQLRRTWSAEWAFDGGNSLKADMISLRGYSTTETDPRAGSEPQFYPVEGERFAWLRNEPDNELFC